MNGKSGKLVAPAVALMLCAVALVGVGFAISLNSTSTASNNVSIDGLVLDVNSGSDNSTFVKVATVYYETTQTIGGDPVYKYKLDEVVIAEGKISVASPKYPVTLTYNITEVEGIAYKVYINGNEFSSGSPIADGNVATLKIVAFGNGNTLISVPSANFEYTVTFSATVEC